MKKRRKKLKGKSSISDYKELVAIKNELRKNIYQQEKSFRNDFLDIGGMYSIFRSVFSKGKKKKNLFIHSPTTMMLNGYLVQVLEPYAKSEKQRQFLIPLVSSGISYFVVDRINAKLNKLLSRQPKQSVN